MRESAAQGFGLRARQARLRALAEGTAFSAATGGRRRETRIVTEERAPLLRRARLSWARCWPSTASRHGSSASRTLRDAPGAARPGAAWTRASRSSPRRAPLLASGAVSEVDILRLERDASPARAAETEQATAQIARAGRHRQAQRKIQETELTFRNDSRKELADVVGKLNTLNEGAVALADKVDKSQIKSPCAAACSARWPNTVGGVVQPGKDIVDRAADDALVLEARIQPGHRLHLAPSRPRR